MTNLWQQIAENKQDWIGGVLINDKHKWSTVVTDVVVGKTNGFPYFQVQGEKFNVGGHLKNSGLLTRQDENTITISGQHSNFVMHKSTKQKELDVAP